MILPYLSHLLFDFLYQQRQAFVYQFKVQLIRIIIQEQRESIMSYNIFEQLDNEDKSVPLAEFYERILKDMIERVYKDNKYRNKGMDEETIDELEKKIRALLNDPNRLFQLANNYREGTLWFKTIEANIIKQDAKDLQLIARERSCESIRNIESNKSLTVLSIDQGGDSNYLELNPNIQNSTSCLKKIEETQNLIDSSHESIEQYNYSSSQACKTPPEVNCHESISSRIVGRYNDRGIKYKAEKYMIHFTDVFIKTSEGEAYLQNMFMDMEWMSKYSLPSLNQ